MANGEQGHSKFSWWALVTTSAIVASASATATWYVARAHIDDELRQYERSKEWQLPALLKELGETSKRINLQLQERQELERLRGEVSELAQRNAAVTAKLQTIEADRESLKKQLAEFQADRFELREGEARVLVPGELAVGVKYVSSGEAEIQFGNEPRRIAAGTTLTAIAGGRRYAVTLVRVGASACTFSVSQGSVPKR
jgi:seryl-tRNA synthetase